MTKEHEYFNYYCLDRMKVLDNELPLAYDDEGLIRKIYYKIGLIAQVKHILSYILYTEEDFDNLIYIPCEFVDNNKESLFLYPQNKQDLFEQLKTIQTMNIFQFMSMLTFTYIFEDFKEIVDYNWDNLNMNSLIEM